MPLYYFDVHDCDGLHHDEVGDQFDTLEDAIAQAQSLLPDIAREELPDGELRIIACDVRDDARRIIYRGKLTFEGTRDPEGEASTR